MIAHKLEIDLNIQRGDKACPYYWCIKEITANINCKWSKIAEGWENSPKKAFKSACKYFETNIKDVDELN